MGASFEVPFSGCVMASALMMSMCENTNKCVEDFKNVTFYFQNDLEILPTIFFIFWVLLILNLKYI